MNCPLICPFRSTRWESAHCEEGRCALFLKSNDEDRPSRCALAIIGMELSSLAMSAKIEVDLKTRFPESQEGEKE